MTTSDGSRASARISTVSLPNFESRILASVRLETVMIDLAPGGKTMVLPSAESFLPRLQRAFVSSRKTGICPAVTRGRKVFRDCHARKFVDEDVWATPRKSSKPDQ